MTASWFSRSACVVAMAFLWTLAVKTASADLLPPPQASKAAPAPVQPSPFVVRRDPVQEISRILIPRKLLAGGQALPAAVGAGIALTIVIAGGGLAVAFARRRKAGTGALLSIGLVVSLLLIGTALADIPVPGGRARRPTPGPAPVGGPTVIVETVDSGDQVILILGKNAPNLPK